MPAIERAFYLVSLGSPKPGPFSRGHPVISRARRVSHAALVNEGRFS
jgi:hypothetical protein